MQVTNDLQVVKVYVSILADPEKQKQTMDVLHKLEGFATQPNKT
jgi:ribosome-binding factor A